MRANTPWDSELEQGSSRRFRSHRSDPNVTVREMLKLLQRNGWEIQRQRGSHWQLKHPEKSGVVTVAGNLGNEIDKGTLHSICTHAGMDWPPQPN